MKGCFQVIRGLLSPLLSDVEIRAVGCPHAALPEGALGTQRGFS